MHFPLTRFGPTSLGKVTERSSTGICWSLYYSSSSGYGGRWFAWSALFYFLGQNVCNLHGWLTRFFLLSWRNDYTRVQFSSVAQSCPTLCNPINHSTPGLPVHHQLSEFTQTHVHRVGDAIQPSHPLSSPSPPIPNPSQHQGLFQWANSHEVAKVLEFQLQHQSFQWTPRTDLL